MTELLIGIPTFNGHKRLDYLLQSIITRTSNSLSYKIIICDDSGNLESIRLTSQVINKYNLFTPIKLIYNKQNSGVATSWNSIIESDYDLCPYIILINDDIIIAKESLESMMFFLKNNPYFGAVSYELYNLKEEDMKKMVSSNINSNKITPIPTRNDFPIKSLVAWGPYWGFTRDKYNQVQGFDSNYFLYFEETDFCMKLADLGYPNYILRHPRSWHVGSASMSSINVQENVNKSYSYFQSKWKGKEKTLMNNIQDMKIKWIYNDSIYEIVAKCEGNSNNRIY